ncbi:uncharacterized protein LOC115769676 isoform X2 [Drosophila novamexicana]|uniref:uncharacterized protein LOC115769676 isoform X2 n=1 Tax=Drosophila novamexicana TaxID=47314 RepID=UPI0011E5C6A1|nr:uncharacterized protein LOC115769676 isoform X2 [Drosophila novamexicana]
MRKRKELEAGPLHLWPYKKHHNYVFPFMRIEKPSTGQGKNVNNFTLPRDTHTHPRINSCMAFYEALTKKQANGQCSKNKFLCGHMRMFDLYIPCVVFAQINGLNPVRQTPDKCTAVPQTEKTRAGTDWLAGWLASHSDPACSQQTTSHIQPSTANTQQPPSNTQHQRQRAY